MSDRLDALVDTKLMVLRFDPERLRRCRKALRVTQPELARALGVSVQSVSGWERGVQAPVEEHIAALEHFMQRAETVEREGAD